MATAEVTADDLAVLRTLTTSRIRKNYHLCQQQLDVIVEQGCQPRHDDAAWHLSTWQGAYLDELVRRGERV